LLPSAIKGWHLHYNQEDIWFVFPDSHLLVGLWDLREDSPTKNQTMRITLGGGKSQLLYIPRGVAHGTVNLSSRNADLIYFINQQFSLDQPDEHRIPWDTLGEDFWTYTKD
jgi:dTDP-4-dehydrorhamnose 3,5-epimerase